MENTLRYSSAAQNFNEALPIGNGSLGAMVYGKTDIDRISLNHDTLWAGKPEQFMVEGAFEANERAKKLILEGRNAEAQRELEEHFSGPWISPYLLLGTLFIERIESSGNVSNYIRQLDLEDSLVQVRYHEDGVDFEREYFVSYPDNCLMIKLRSSKPVSYKISGDCVGKSAVVASKDSLILTGECPSYIVPSYHREEKPDIYARYDGEGVKVTASAKIKCDGKIEVDGYHSDNIIIKNALDVTVYFCAETSFVAFNKRPDKPTFDACVQRVNALANKSYEDIRSAHLADVRPLYRRVSIDLNGGDCDKMTDERLLSNQKEIGLLELLYNFGRYLLIASSRKGSRATHGQGIWNESYFAAWGSHYTTNINIQMNYWAALMCDLADCNLPLVNLIEELSINGEETAKHYYHADGFTVHHNTDIWAKTTPVGNKRPGGANFAYWNLGGAWLCDHLFEHYEYTLDKDFLADTAYPIMKKAAEFFLSVLTEYNGKLILTPTTSPENEFYCDGDIVSVCLYSAMTQQLIESLFRNISRSADILGIDDDFVRDIREKIPRVSIYEIGSQGQLLEFDKEFEEKDPHHRHISHLYALYPANLITTESNAAISDGVKRSLQIRGSNCTGWGMCWRAALWAKLKDGDTALDTLKAQLRYIPSEINRSMPNMGGTYPNLFNSCPPLQIDGSFGIVAVISQFFLQCEDGKIKVLPALPTKIPSGSLRGIMAKGNVKLDIEWQDSKLSHLSLISPITQTVTVNVDGEDHKIALEANKKYIFA